MCEFVVGKSVNAMVVRLLLIGLVVGVAVAVQSPGAAEEGVAEAVAPAEAVTPPQEAPKAPPRLRVGAVQLQYAFQNYSRTQDLLQEVRRMQAEASMSKEEVQGFINKRQAALAEEFKAAVKEVMPEVAKDVGVPLIAGQIAYTDGSIQVENLSLALVKKINDRAKAQAETEAKAGDLPEAPEQPPTPPVVEEK